MRRALALFLLAPLVAEFLLGDFTFAQLPYLILLAPAYGGAAVLIREVTRRSGRGWPAMVLLALAYGVLEEGLETQSLFNPDYLNAHLLGTGFVPALGISVPWTIFVLTLHTVWSMSVPIALVERDPAPWLGRAGLTVFAVLAAIGAAGTFAVSYADGHFLASPAQMAVTGFIVLALIVVAFRLPRERRPLPGSAPRPWQVLLVTLLGGAVFELGADLPTAPLIITLTAVIVAVTGALLIWSRRAGWTPLHQLAAAAGGLLTYAWHSFLSHPLASTAPALVPISHAGFALLAVALLAFDLRRLRARPALPPTPADDLGHGAAATSVP